MAVNKNLYLYICATLLFFHYSGMVGGQSFERLDSLCGDSQKFQIQMTMDNGVYNKIRSSKGNKYSFSKVKLQFNGFDVPVKSMKLHGKTSLYFPKKSFSLKLKDQVAIPDVQDTVLVKNCFLLSLAMDRNYTVNYTAYSLLKSLNIFNLTYRFCEVVINNKTQGIYLIMERPRDYAFRTLKSPVLIRRGFNNEIDGLDLNEKEYSGKSKYFRQKYNHLYSFCHKYSGAELYDSLSNSIDLKQYMRWLGFNYLVRNGDYTDELFLYYDTSQNLFKIIPWDYDDLFVLYPHEGQDVRRTVQGGQFIFSSEDLLDQTIIKDQFLYQKYLDELNFITQQLTDQLLHEIFQKTYCAVYPYYLDDKVIESTRFDKYGLTSKEDLYNNMQEKLNALQGMRNMVDQELNVNSAKQDE